jgi:hypothetical protein
MRAEQRFEVDFEALEVFDLSLAEFFVFTGPNAGVGGRKTRGYHAVQITHGEALHFACSFQSVDWLGGPRVSGAKRQLGAPRSWFS